MKITDCKKASIYDLDRIYICDASVSFSADPDTQADADSPDCVTLAFPDLEADNLRSEVYVTFFDRIEGLVTYYCTLSNYKETLSAPGLWHSSVLCTLGEEVEIQQRRNDVKVQIHMDTVISFKNSEDVLINISAVIRNISAGGLFFTCHYPFRPGNTLSLAFENSLSKANQITAEILRVQPKDDLPLIIGTEANDETLMGYGCRFVNLSPYTESLIRNFVFKKDLVERKKLL